MAILFPLHRPGGHRYLPGHPYTARRRRKYPLGYGDETALRQREENPDNLHHSIRYVAEAKSDLSPKHQRVSLIPESYVSKAWLTVTSSIKNSPKYVRTTAFILRAFFEAICWRQVTRKSRAVQNPLVQNIRLDPPPENRHGSGRLEAFSSPWSSGPLIITIMYTSATCSRTWRGKENRVMEILMSLNIAAATAHRQVLASAPLSAPDGILVVSSIFIMRLASLPSAVLHQHHHTDNFLIFVLPIYPRLPVLRRRPWPPSGCHLHRHGRLQISVIVVMPAILPFYITCSCRISQPCPGEELTLIPLTAHVRLYPMGTWSSHRGYIASIAILIIGYRGGLGWQPRFPGIPADVRQTPSL
jgi:hypothetical protein